MAPNFFVRTVGEGEQSFSSRLKTKRETLFVSKKTAAQDLKVLEKYLTAVEEDDQALLPANIYTINILKRYALYLKEDPELIVKLFKTSRHLSLAEEPFNQKTVRQSLAVRSRIMQYAVSACFALGVLGYLLFKTIVITSPPNIIVYEPTDNNIVSSPMLVVRGKSEPGVNLKINGQSVSLADDGQFSQELVLGTGVNIIKISGSKRYSRERVVIRQITVSSGKNLGFDIR